MKKTINKENQSIAKFKTEDGDLSFDVTLEHETVWLTQKQIKELFDTTQQNVSLHLKNIFHTNELDEESVHKYFLYTSNDGKKYRTKHYNLDIILSVGYRVKSTRATQFRIWATKVLKEHLIQGYSINEKRLIERKIELEVKESNDIMNRIFWMKGIKDTKEAQQIIENVSLYLGNTLDKETMVLKAQILIERFMIQFLKRQAKNEKALDNSRFTFRHLITMSQLQHEPEEKAWLWELLNKLCKIRNDFAHVLEVNLVEDVIEDFIRVCTLRLKKEGLSITKDNNDLKAVLVHLCGAVSSTLQEEALAS